MEAITADLVAHNKDCYEKTLIELGLEPKPEEHDDTEETEDIEPPADNSDGNDPRLKSRHVQTVMARRRIPCKSSFLAPSSFFSLFSSVTKTSFGGGYLYLAVAIRLVGTRRALQWLFLPHLLLYVTRR